jgi:hypothetical protein
VNFNVVVIDDIPCLQEAISRNSYRKAGEAGIFGT